MRGVSWNYSSSKLQSAGYWLKLRLNSGVGNWLNLSENKHTLGRHIRGSPDNIYIDKVDLDLDYS